MLQETKGKIKHDLLLFLLFSVLFSSFAHASLSHYQILSKVHDLSSRAVQLGRLANGKLDTPKVKAFNNRMVNDHQTSIAALSDVARQLKLNLPTATKSESKELTNLDKLKGKAFEKEYVSKVINHHANFLNTLKDKLIPAAKSPYVKMLLSQYVPKISTLLDSANSLNKVSEEKN